MSINHKQTFRITITFFSQTVIYILCVMRRVICAIYFSLTSKQTHLMVSKLQIFDVVSHLPFINCVVNPFIDGFTTRRFRYEVRSFLCGAADPDSTSSSQPDVRANEIITDHIHNSTSQSDCLPTPPTQVYH